MTDQRTNPADAARKLEAALAALGLVVDPDDAAALTPASRTGAAAGAIMATLIDLVVDAAVDESGNTDLDVHRAMVYALDATAGDMRAEQLYAYLNVLQLWGIGPAMQNTIGPDQALSLADHLEAAKDHVDGDEDAHNVDTEDDGPEVQYTGPFYAGDTRGAPDADLMAEFTPPDPDPVKRISRASMALGLLPGIAPSDDNDIPHHPGFAVATIAGALAARSTLEMVNACRDIPEEHRYPITQLWCRGFGMGLITTPEGDVSDTAVAGIMMRIMGMIAAWHVGAAETPRALAVGDLCLAAVHAARADGLESSSIDLQAEYIALHGVDNADSHREAVTLAESGLAALRNLDTM